MNQQAQQALMLKFSLCKYKHGGNSYEEADCAGTGQRILNDYAGYNLPDDRLMWAGYFEILPWPTELKEFDVLLMQHSNMLELVDHIAVHIGGGYVASLGRQTGGLIVERASRYESKILHVARYKKP